jgi:hypothetical protein
VAKSKVIVPKKQAIDISSDRPSSSGASIDEEPERPLSPEVDMPDADDFGPFDDDRCDLDLDLDFDDDDAPSVGTRPVGERRISTPSVSLERAYPGLGDASSALKRKRNDGKGEGSPKRFDTSVRKRKPTIVKEGDKTKKTKDDKKGRGANKPVVDAGPKYTTTKDKAAKATNSKDKPTTLNSQKNASSTPALSSTQTAEKVAKAQAKAAKKREEEEAAKKQKELDEHNKERDREIKEKADRMAKLDEKMLDAQLGVGVSGLVDEQQTAGGEQSKSVKASEGGGEKAAGKKPTVEDEDDLTEDEDEDYIPQAHDLLARYPYKHRLEVVYETTNASLEARESAEKRKGSVFGR